jgi:signal transduction histidine kinase
MTHPMSRPRFAWSVFAICLVATTAAVGWLTHSAWRADQARQQALRESEIRNALWRMDSLVAPLLAIEMNRPSLTVPVAGTAMLAPRLINGYVVRNVSGSWTIRRDGRSPQPEPLAAGSHLAVIDWESRLKMAGPTGVDIADLGQSDLPDTDTPATAGPDDLIVWPQAGPPAQVASNQVAPNQMGQGKRRSQGQELANRSQLVNQVQQIAQAAQQAPTSQQALPPQQGRNSRQSPLAPEPPASTLQVTPLQPLWVEGELVLARQTPAGNGSAASVIELCWLNWPEWEALLAEQLKESPIPLRMEPLEKPAARAAEKPSAIWQMVSLPIRVEPAAPQTAGALPGPFIAVWGLLVAAALAFGWLMRETLALSERRAAFVSAVTHELRTPLTTFRLYTEILTEGLATDPAQQKTYYQTLHREANRLTHLVENVLSYARLEHGRSTARNETLSVGDLLDRCRPRLEQRVAETPLSLSFQVADSTRIARLTTNALAVEQILFNLIDNSCKYARDAADPRIVCNVLIDGAELKIRVSDFGPGLSAAARKALFQPFQKSSSQAAESAPGVGLGLALSHRLARELQGSLRCEPNAPTGLTFEINLPLNSG